MLGSVVFTKQYGKEKQLKLAPAKDHEVLTTAHPEAHQAATVSFSFQPPIAGYFLYHPPHSNCTRFGIQEELECFQTISALPLGEKASIIDPFSHSMNQATHLNRISEDAAPTEYNMGF